MLVWFVYATKSQRATAQSHAATLSRVVKIAGVTSDLVFGACAETPFGNVERCFAYFKDLVLCHAVKVRASHGCLRGKSQFHFSFHAAGFSLAVVFIAGFFY